MKILNSWYKLNTCTCKTKQIIDAIFFYKEEIKKIRSSYFCKNSTGNVPLHFFRIKR